MLRIAAVQKPSTGTNSTALTTRCSALWIIRGNNIVQLYNLLLSLSPGELRRSKHEADQSFLNQGITFTVYGNDKGTERIFPQDLLPRIITGGGMGKDRARTHSADHGAESLPRRYVYHEEKSSETVSWRVRLFIPANITAGRCTA